MFTVRAERSTKRFSESCQQAAITSGGSGR